MKKFLFILVILVLAASLVLNGYQYMNRRQSEMNQRIVFPDANTRENYNSVHRVREAHAYGTGKGIRVGILDTWFGTEKHPELYAGAEDFTGKGKSLTRYDDHGYWMAVTLREIAPDAEIYALNVRQNNKRREAKAVTAAIDWAVENDLDILTWSAGAFEEKYRKQIDRAADYAAENGIVLTFIHYDHDVNILPYGMFFNYHSGEYGREPDLRLYPFDYNVLRMPLYQDYVRYGLNEDSGDGMPYFSYSSMSPLLAGFVAVLMEIYPGLTPGEYRGLLTDTSREYYYRGRDVRNVPDLAATAAFLKDRQEASARLSCAPGGEPLRGGTESFIEHSVVQMQNGN